jgi:hypothetical protein
MKYTILSTIALALTAMFVFSYPSTGLAHHSQYHSSKSNHDFVIDLDQAMKNRDIVLMAVGTAVYYQDNCAGLTHQGMRYLNRALVMHSINTNRMHEDSQYQIGFKIAKGYPSCNKLRFAITDAGLGAMIR